jgi:hypothetical protein
MVKIVVSYEVCNDPTEQGVKVSPNLKIDAILREQLENAVESSKSVAAVVKLKSADPVKATLPPEKVREVAESVLDRARERSGQTETDYFVLDVLGAFNLVAPARFVIEVLNQPEVASAFSAETEENTHRAINPQGSQERLPESKPSRFRVH